MDLLTLAQRTGLRVITPPPRAGVCIARVAQGAHISRLLDQAGGQTLLVTRLAGCPIVRVADLMGAPAICLTDRQLPGPDVLAEAAACRVAVLVADTSMEETWRRLTACLREQATGDAAVGAPPKAPGGFGGG